ncbi:serine O-acetyltransferase [Aurantiacibacter aquimixticola]|uniref:Serine acetyltransferase n=1 Tax=Aurantiacibacter aquimixticola TaxID=1958945 RepID=A0A419RSI2_9SPHN|nr:hypothetical protein [Aurantiacibacter aquimixticola]RJY08738.1 hypothetical protein D6201_04635 [Aurantiacibacter aquimixticola]
MKSLLSSFVEASPLLSSIYRRYLGDREARLAHAIERMQRHISAGRYGKARRIQKCVELRFGVAISAEARIGKNLQMPHPIGVVIGRGAEIGDNVKIFQNVTIGRKKEACPKIGSGSILYSSSIVIGNIEIGENCIIGANSVVTKSVPSHTTVAGNPARVIVKSGRGP